MSTERQPESNSVINESPAVANIAGWAGIGFAIIAAGLYGALFSMLHNLPSARNELDEFLTNAPALTRLIVVAASAALLNIVALILCLTGFLAPRRPRIMPVIGTTLSALMLVAVFSVVVASLCVSPPR